jgi:hypothetical protein
VGTAGAGAEAEEAEAEGGREAAAAGPGGLRARGQAKKGERGDNTTHDKCCFCSYCAPIVFFPRSFCVFIGLNFCRLYHVSCPTAVPLPLYLPFLLPSRFRLSFTYINRARAADPRLSGPIRGAEAVVRHEGNL